MCMNQQQILALAYGSLMALIFAGTYVLGDDSWMAYLLFIPGFLVLKAMGASDGSEDLAEGHGRSSDNAPETLLPSVKRLTRIVLALIVLSIPAALLMRAFDLNDPIMALVLIPVLLLGSLVDREYFGWSDPSDHAERSPTA